MGSKSLIRSRWAAIGAAVAVTLGGGGLIGVSAASGDASSLKTTTPTRIMDTRQGSDGKVSGETVALQVTGEITTYASNGATPAATVVPAGANAVAVNLTVTQGERNQGYGFVTAFPCAADTDTVPNASTLNFVEGTDVANSTVVPLGATGKMCLNVYGSAHVIVDVSGYYETAAGGTTAVDAYTKAESDDMYEALGRDAGDTTVYTSVNVRAFEEWLDISNKCSTTNRTIYGGKVFEIDGDSAFSCTFSAPLIPPPLGNRIREAGKQRWIPTGVLMCIRDDMQIDNLKTIDDGDFGRLIAISWYGLNSQGELVSAESETGTGGTTLPWAAGTIADNEKKCLHYRNEDAYHLALVDMDTTREELADWEGVNNYTMQLFLKEEGADEPSYFGIDTMRVSWALADF